MVHVFVVMALYSSCSYAIRYVLPVLWMTPLFNTVGTAGA